MGNHLPGWFKGELNLNPPHPQFCIEFKICSGLLPKSALTAEEEAWNSYPYTKTRYTCPFVEKFSIEIETYYYSDNGNQDNVFKLSGSDMRNRSVGMNKFNNQINDKNKI